MSALNRKVIRDLRAIWAQALAIALVLACGGMVLVLAHSTERALSETRAAYYDRNRFANVFATATRAPQALLAEIAAIPGVAVAEGRVGFHLLLDLEGMVEPAVARVISLPLARPPRLNVPILRAGRLPDPARPDEVALSEPFALVHGLLPGTRFVALLNGARRELQVVGHVLSPEFIYTIGPGSLMPDDRRYGLIWMGAEAAEAAAGRKGAFNEVSLRLSRGAREDAVIAALDGVLAPYGGTGAYGRDRQGSDQFLQGELDQLQAMGRILPPVFLIVSAFLVNMVIGRLVATERRQIGLLKAVGYSTAEVAGHYLRLAALIGAVGVVIGWAAGAWLGQAMTALYADFYRFPWLIYAPGSGAFVISGVLGMATALAGAWRAVRTSASLPPAVAMAPPLPPAYGAGRLDGLPRTLGAGQLALMVWRGITRFPGRAAVTVAGIAASVAVLIAAFSTYDAVRAVAAEVFGAANRQEVTLTLTDETRAAPALEAAQHLPGVLRAEGGYALQVRLSHGPRSRFVALEAHEPGDRMAHLLDSAGRPVALPPRGLVLPRGLAAALGARPGDRLRLQRLTPPYEEWDLPLSGVIRQSLGQSAHIDAETLHALLRQSPRVNRIDLRVDPARLPALHAEVKRSPVISGLTLWSDLRRQFDETLRENLLISSAIYSALGMLITLGVVYNAARIRLAERAHELATLRVLGFTRAEVGWVLLGETLALTALALPLGWAAGYGFAALMVAGFSTELISIPLVVSRQTYGFASLMVLGTALAAGVAVRRRLDRVDLVGALKQRE